MLQIKHLKIIHKKDLRVILDDFSLVLNPGDKAVIIGEEGNGKSTLLKWIYDPALAEDYAEISGERVLTQEKLGYLPQELARADYEKSVYEFFCEEPAIWDRTPRELEALAARLKLPLELFYSEQLMKTLSGGERVKVQMARILLGEPSLLLLDEPSNDIDIPTLEWLEQQITAWNGSVLYISHDETLIERTANRVIHLEQIRRKTLSRYTVANMPYQDYIAQRSAQMANQRRQAENDRRQEQIRQEKFNRIQQKVEHDLRSVSRQNPHGGQLLKKKMKAVKSLEKRYEREARDMAQLPEEEDAIFIKFKDTCRIPAGKTVLDFTLDRLEIPQSSCMPVENTSDTTQSSCTPGENALDTPHFSEVPRKNAPARLLASDIHLRVRGSEKLCIVGRNGAGKSTLLRQIAAELLRRPDLRAAYMPQNYEEELDGDLTPVEYLAQRGDKEELTQIRTYLGAMKYTAQEMLRPVRELSGGQRAKLFLLKLSMSEANVLILDEPTRNFSPLSNPVIREVLSDYGGVILSVSHDRKYIYEVCDRVLELTPDGLREQSPEIRA